MMTVVHRHACGLGDKLLGSSSLNVMERPALSPMMQLFLSCHRVPQASRENKVTQW